MSCWRKYTCDVLKDVDKRKLHEAVQELGYDINFNLKTVESEYEKRTEKVDGVLLNKYKKELTLGLIVKDETGHTQIVGDFWNTGVDRASFMDNLSQTYQKLNAIEKAQLAGWTVDTVTNTERGVEIEFYCS